MSAKDIESELGGLMEHVTLTEYQDCVVLKQKGFLKKDVWTKLADKVRDLGGKYLEGQSSFEIPLKIGFEEPEKEYKKRGKLFNQNEYVKVRRKDLQVIIDLVQRLLEEPK